MEWESIIVAIAIVFAALILFKSFLYVHRIGFRYARKSTILFIKSPIKTIKLMKKLSQERKEFRVNRNIWLRGKELDKIDDLLRYKSDRRVMESPKVKLSLNIYNKNILKKETKELKVASKDKKFDRITK